MVQEPELVLTKNLTVTDSIDAEDAQLTITTRENGRLSVQCAYLEPDLCIPIEHQGGGIPTIRAWKKQWVTPQGNPSVVFGALKTNLVGDPLLREFLDSLPPLNTGQQAYVNSVPAAFKEIRNSIEHDRIQKKMTVEGAAQWAELWARLYPAAAEHVQGERPTAGFYDGYYDVSYYAGLNGELFTGSWREMAEAVFGEFRKPLARALRGTNLCGISALHDFSELFSLDEWAQLFDEFRALDVSSRLESLALHLFGRTGFIQALSPLSYASRRDILMQSISYEQVGDVLDMVERLATTFRARVHSLEELHDALVALPMSAYVQEDDDKEIILPEDIAEAFPASLPGGVEVIPLVRSSQFLYAASALDNCLSRGGYLARGWRGHSYCFLLTRAEKPFAALELAPEVSGGYTVAQLYGHKNRVLEEKEKLVESLSELIHIKPDDRKR